MPVFNLCEFGMIDIAYVLKILMNILMFIKLMLFIFNTTDWTRFAKCSLMIQQVYEFVQL